MQTIKDDKLAKLLLKKIRLKIGNGKTVLHLSKKQEQITELLSENNIYSKANSLEGFKNKSFSYIIADLDHEQLDNFEEFLDKVAPLIIRPGLLIIVASNLATFKNQLGLWFGNDLENFQRPCRAVSPGFLRNRLLEKGYFVKNRYWNFDKKLLIMADIPINS